MATIEADPYEKGRRGMRKLLRGFLRMVWGGDDVLLSGYYGYGSLGDEAVLDRIVTALRERIPGCRIGVLAGGSSLCGSNLDVRRVGRKNPFAVLWALLRCRMLISGGGSLLQDATSRRSLWYYTAIIRIAHLLGVQVFLYANGIGPLHECRRAQKALYCGDRISVRDPDSLYAVLAMGVDPERVFLSADPIFLLYPEILPSLSGEKSPYFVVSLRTCRHGKIEEDVVAAACEKLREQGLQAVFVSMQDSYDRALCERVCRRCGGVMAPAMSPTALASFLSEARFVISMRLHCILMAALSGTPAVALSYDCKIDSAMEYLEQTTTLDAFFFTEDMLLSACRKVSARGEEGRMRLRRRSEALFHMAQKDANTAAGLLTAGAPVGREGSKSAPVSVKL